MTAKKLLSEMAKLLAYELQSISDDFNGQYEWSVVNACFNLAAEILGDDDWEGNGNRLEWLLKARDMYPIELREYVMLKTQGALDEYTLHSSK